MVFVDEIMITVLIYVAANGTDFWIAKWYLVVHYLDTCIHMFLQQN